MKSVGNSNFRASSNNQVNTISSIAKNKRQTSSTRLNYNKLHNESNSLSANLLGSNPNKNARSKEKKIVNLSESMNNMFLNEASCSGRNSLNNAKLHKGVTPKSTYFDTNYDRRKTTSNGDNNSNAKTKNEGSKLNDFYRNTPGTTDSNNIRGSLNNSTRMNSGELIGKFIQGKFDAHHPSNEDAYNRNIDFNYREKLREHALNNNSQTVGVKDVNPLFHSNINLNEMAVNQEFQNKEDNFGNYNEDELQEAEVLHESEQNKLIYGQEGKEEAEGYNNFNNNFEVNSGQTNHPQKENLGENNNADNYNYNYDYRDSIGNNSNYQGAKQTNIKNNLNSQGCLQ